ncbi:hypothetical protein PHMEG_0005282 [Phytophthora megakarya]|uniref:Uncharacterized protein n=1 Tax=Phytophthora megakarya TaxID=4795 RepID=A0A225WRV8_9STRA|nr:hypothetical protein PHMEG_0005282 [Phytophthora megakarya]
MILLLTLLEVQHKFYSTARHFAGSDNVKAEAGSRVCQSEELAKVFADMSCQGSSELKETLVGLGAMLQMVREAVDANAAQLGVFAVDLGGMSTTGVNAGHAILLRGIRRFTDSVVKQQPLSPDLLRNVYHVLDLRCSRGQLLWGGLLLAFFFLLRRSEYLFISKRHHSYVLRLRDVIFQDCRGGPAKPHRADVVWYPASWCEEQSDWTRGAPFPSSIR